MRMEREKATGEGESMFGRTSESREGAGKRGMILPAVFLFTAVLLLCMMVRSGYAWAYPITANLSKENGAYYVKDAEGNPLKGKYVFGRWMFTTGADGKAVRYTKKKKGLAFRNGRYVYYYKTNKLAKNKFYKKAGLYYDKNGYAVAGPYKIKKVWYFFDPETCRLMKGEGNHTVVINNVEYFVNKNGAAVTGWQKEGDRLVYYSKTGRKVKNKKVNGIQLDEEGYAEAGAKKPKEVSPVMKKANAVVANLTSNSMSKSGKLRACWNYITGGSFRYVITYPNLGRSGWQRTTALNMLNTKGGNCYSFACGFAALAKACGYNPYVVAGLCHGTRDGRADGLTRHCVVKINGAWYDPEAQFAGWGRGIYGVGYSPLVQIQQTVAF